LHKHGWRRGSETCVTPRQGGDVPTLAVLAVSALLGSTTPPAAPALETYAQYRLTFPEDGETYGSLRRLKLMLTDRLGEGARYYVQGLYKDNNRSATDEQPYLQEAWVQWPVGRGKARLGQFKPPVGLERFTADWDLAVINRSLATDSLIPNGKLGDGKGFARDRGVQWETKFARQRGWWAIGLFEGHGANVDPRGVAPLLATRLTWTAAAGDESRLRVGGAFSTRVAQDMDFSKALPGTAGLGYADFGGRDTRWNLEFALDRPGFRLRGEISTPASSPMPSGCPASRETASTFRRVIRSASGWRRPSSASSSTPTPT